MERRTLAETKNRRTLAEAPRTQRTQSIYSISNLKPKISSIILENLYFKNKNLNLNSSLRPLRPRVSAREILKFPVLFLVISFFLISCDFSFGEKKVEDPTWETITPLKDIYKSHFPIGNIVANRNEITTMRFDILKRHFNAATAENDMKPDYIAPQNKPAPGAVWNYRFSNADAIVNAARAAGMEMHGHTLVWHSQTPSWLTRDINNNNDLDRDEVLANLQKYVTDVTTHFKGRLTTWDVANEVFRDSLQDVTASTDWKTCLRVDAPSGQSNTSFSPWNRIIGPEFIEIAFLAARDADPGVKLYYNDYNLNNPNKAQAVFNMVKDINTRHSNVGGRKLIDGIGMQSHHHIYTSPQSVEASIILFSQLGVEIAITELDIQAAGTFGDRPQIIWGENAARLQADQYAAMFRIFKKYSNIITRVTFWGLDDGTSWRSNTHPTLLDKDYNLKPAFFAVVNP